MKISEHEKRIAFRTWFLKTPSDFQGLISKWVFPRQRLFEIMENPQSEEGKALRDCCGFAAHILWEIYRDGGLK